MIRKFQRTSSRTIESQIPIEKLEEQIRIGKKLILSQHLPLLLDLNKHIEKYIKTHKRIIYGGTAVSVLIKAKDQTFKMPEFLDYDFYSPNNEFDSISIANILYNAKYKYVRRIPALHPNTYRIGAEFAPEFIADITLIPSDQYEKIPKVLIDGLFYIDPQYAKIDLYVSVSNPHTNTNRWIKALNRVQSLERLYPLSFNKQEILKENKIQKQLLKKYSKLLSGAFITGIGAYNLIYKDAQIEENIIEAYVLQMPNLPKGYTVIEKGPYLDIFEKYYEVYTKSGIHIITFYIIGAQCLSHIEINKHKIVSYFYLLRFLYIKYNETKKNKYAFAINCLLNPAKNKENDIEFSILPLCYEAPSYPYCIFDTNCTTKDKEEVRLAPYSRFFYNTEKIKGYKPEKKYIEPEVVQ